MAHSLVEFHHREMAKEGLPNRARFVVDANQDFHPTYAADHDQVIPSQFFRRFGNTVEIVDQHIRIDTGFHADIRLFPFTPEARNEFPGIVSLLLPAASESGVLCPVDPRFLLLGQKRSHGPTYRFCAGDPLLHPIPIQSIDLVFRKIHDGSHSDITQ